MSLDIGRNAAQPKQHRPNLHRQHSSLDTHPIHWGPQGQQPSLDMAAARSNKPIPGAYSEQDGASRFAAPRRTSEGSPTASDPTTTITTGRAPPGSSSTSSISNSRRPSLRDQSSLTSTLRAPLRPPNPAKKVSGRDELHSIITRQAIADEQRSVAVTSPSHHPFADQPIASPLSPSSSSPSPSAVDLAHPTMAYRTTSIDSTASSLTSTTAGPMTTTPAGAAIASRAPGPQEVADLIAAAGGSAEAALQKLLAEKQQAASHTAQLWRLVEKQRSMILGLNKDLEKTHKEKEKYRKRVKEHLAQSASMPALVNESPGGGSQPSESAELPRALVAAAAASASAPLRDIKLESPPTGDRSETATNAVITSAPPPTGVSSQLQPHIADANRRVTPGSVDGAPRVPTSRFAHKTSASASSIPSSPLQIASSPTPHISSPKTRKAPPAPLKLKPELDLSVSRHIVDASDSEYEDDPDSARSEYIERGRRKTREEDDRKREAAAMQEQEHRSRSKKDKAGKKDVPAVSVQAARDGAATILPDHAQAKAPVYQPTGAPADILRGRAVSDAAAGLLRHNTAPSLLSPGLPMSPRPSDRPLNSPMPRAPFNSIPMSPRAGLPLSPRAPRQPLPLPPQTPLSMISPHLDRAKGYQHLAQMSTQAPTRTAHVAERPRPSLEGTPDTEYAGTGSSEPTPGDIYRGFVTEQYPDLLLPPNALPSIFVKTASSRMKPSRASMIMPKPGEENPVFTLAVHERSEDRPLWRVEKTFHALAVLDQQIRAVCGTLREHLPDKALFVGHAPSKIDARRVVLNTYFQNMLDAIVDERAAEVVCRFLSTDALGVEHGDYFGSTSASPRDSPIHKLRPNRAGYLTKRGKNFGGWKARYFVLDGPILKYFEGPGGAQLGVIKLQNAQIGKQSNAPHSTHEDEENQFRHAFLVLEPKRKDSSSLVRHVLCAESDEERDAWVDALLQYVDYRDDEEPQAARQAQVTKADIGGPRSPRSQKSLNDLRSPLQKDKSVEAFQAVSYNDMVAGEAPAIAAASPSSPSNQSPSPRWEHGDGSNPGHPTISGPTNMHVIQNTGDWGLKPPPTPNTAKDRKRGVFHMIHRNRPSIESVPDKVNPTPLLNVRPVFGLPLAEAVEVARSEDVDTPLPVVVHRCIEYLMAQNAIVEEGIFRLSGSNTVIRGLKERFNTEGDVNLLADGTYYDVHAVASLLKLYLRELPASILTRELHLEFLDCLNLPAEMRVPALNVLISRLPSPNRALLDALSAFLLAIVNNVDMNKMNVRNLGVVFSPTLNLPGPLISIFVEEQDRIFGPLLEVPNVPLPTRGIQAPVLPPTDLRSPRKQMFSDLPTPAYNQTHFQPPSAFHPPDDTGMIPMRPTYATYQMAPQGEGGFGSLNDALRSPILYSNGASGQPTARDIKAQRRESAMMSLNHNPTSLTKQPSLSRLNEEAPPDL